MFTLKLKTGTAFNRTSLSFRTHIASQSSFLNRCHRIGQLATEVKVFFADVATTVDEVMAHLNLIKSNNAAIVLADGSEIARTAQGNMTYKELAGLVGDLVRAVRTLRQIRARDHYGSPLAQLGDDAILAQVEAAKKSAKAKREVKPEGDESKTSTLASVLRICGEWCCRSRRCGRRATPDSDFAVPVRNTRTNNCSRSL